MKGYEIYKSSHIYTVTSGMVDGALTVCDGKITNVGPVSTIPDEILANAKVVDYKDQLIMPGLIDGHTHMMPYIAKVDLSKAHSIAECVALVKEFYEKNQDADILIGEKWYAANWGGAMPSKYDIDETVKEIPFFASDLDIHLVWANSKMLEKLGISKETIFEKTNGKPEMVEVDEDGEPTGLLRDEMAMAAIIEEKPPVTTETIKKMFDVWTQYGVTSVNDMDFYTADSEIFLKTRELEEQGELNVRVFASLDAKQATDESIRQAKGYMTSDMFRLNALKVFMDGTGAGYTASMKQEYKGKHTKGCTYTDKEDISRFIHLADQHHLALHVHCCGDAAVSDVLDVYENEQKKGVQFDKRFSIEHMDTTAKEDVKRPAKLGISLNLTPDFLAPTLHWKDNPYLKVFSSDIYDELWRCKSFLDTGVNVAFGTDYTASSMNPMDQLYRAVERKADDNQPEGGFHPNEKISLEEAVYCYTMGSAKSVGMEDKIGSLEQGKYADFIVLEKNIFELPMNEIRNVKVLETFVNGRRIYAASIV